MIQSRQRTQLGWWLLVIAIAAGSVLAGCPSDIDLGYSHKNLQDASMLVDSRSDGDQRDASELDAIPGSDAGTDSGTDSAVYTGPRRVFVTSKTFSPVFGDPNDRHAAQVLARINPLCDSAAHAAGLGGLWKAWIFAGYGTGESISAQTNAGATKGPYVLVDGTTVAFPNAIPDDHVFRALSMTERGTFLAPGELAWVGQFGTDCSALVDGNFLSWTSARTDYFSRAGNPTNGADWNNAARQLRCNELAHLYCFEQ